MKSVAVLAYNLTIEYSLTVLTGITDFFNSKGDVNVIVIPVKTPFSNEYQYDYQYWNITQLLKSKGIQSVVIISNSFLNVVDVDTLSRYLEFISYKPVVSVATKLNIPGSAYTCVSCDSAYMQLVEHLVKKHNRKKIAFYSAELTNLPESRERLNAYKAALKAFNLPVDESLIIHGDFTPKTSYNYIVSHYKSKEDIPFDAILCANDYMAVGCIGAFHDIGISIPEDICVVGFDDAEVAVNSNPTVTTINQHINQTGYKAAEVLYSMLEGKDVNKKVEIDPYPVYRQSCGCISKDVRTDGYLSESGEFVDHNSLTTALNVFGNGLNDMNILTIHLDLTDSITDLDSFFERTKISLQMLGIQLFSLCTFDEPIHLESNEVFELPEKAKLLLQIDNEKNIFENYFDRGGISFNPYEDLVPSNIVIPQNGLYYLTPIFMKKDMYGYIICKLPLPKYPLYVVVFKMLANTFISSYEYSKNIIERQKLVETNQSLDMEARTDELTQVLNRRGFLEHGQRILDLSAVSNIPGAILFCDMDGLKTINDTWGHDIGDKAIVTEAKVLKTAFRETDLIGRLSGDEFGVVATGFQLEKLNQLRKRLIELNEQFSREADLPFTLSISVGAVPFDNENQNLKKLLTLADKELYKEKQLKHPERNYR